MKKNVDLSLAASVLHNWCIIADDTDVSQFTEQEIFTDMNQQVTAGEVGVPNTTSGNAKKALLVDRINRR